MYLGNEIKLSSNRLSYRLYQSDWIAQTESCKKMVIIVMERLKVQQELIVGRIFSLNMESFTLVRMENDFTFDVYLSAKFLQIVNRAYSMFNVLQNMRQKN